MKKYALLVFVLTLIAAVGWLTIYSRKESSRAIAAELKVDALEKSLADLKKFNEVFEGKIRESLASHYAKERALTDHRDALQRAFDAANAYIEVLKPQAEKYREVESKAQAESQRRERIRQQNIEAFKQRQADARRFAAEQAEAQAETNAAQSDMAQQAQSAAEAFFRNDYRPGGNSSVLVMEVSATISSVEQVQGWSGRWRAKGRASIGYYVSSGGSFARESHDFEVELGGGAPKVDVRS